MGKGSHQMQGAKPYLDEEWIDLIIKAKVMGLTSKDIRLFLAQTTKKNLCITDIKRDQANV